MVPQSGSGFVVLRHGHAPGRGASL